MDQHDGPRHAGFGRRGTDASSVGGVLLTAPQHDVVEATLRAVRSGVSLVVVTGDPGSGRSLVADRVADVLLSQGVLVDRGLPPSGLGQEVLLAHAATLLQLDSALLTRAMLPPAPVMVTPGVLRVVAMVVDDADAWPPNALRTLLGLARVRLIDGPLLHVVLTGRAASLRSLLTAEAPPAHASLRIVPLSLVQGREYLARHLAAVPVSGAGLSARAADDILAQAGGSPGRIDALVRLCLASQPSCPSSGTAPTGRRAAGTTLLFRRLAVPAALLASMLMLGVVATALLPHSRTRPALPDAAAPAGSWLADSDTARPERRPRCPPARDEASARAGETARHAPPDPSCPPVPEVLAQLNPLAPPVPVPQPGVLVDPPLLLLHVPAAIRAGRDLSAEAPGLPSLAGLVLPPFLGHLEVVAALASTAGGAVKPGMPPSSRLPTVIAARLPGAARPSETGSASQQAHPGLLPGQLDASALQKSRVPDRAPPRARRHDASPEQPSPAPPADRSVIRDNPEGQVSRAGVPYFCRAIQPGNQAETAYIRQVCGR